MSSRLLPVLSVDSCSEVEKGFQRPGWATCEQYIVSMGQKFLIIFTFRNHSGGVLLDVLCGFSSMRSTWMLPTAVFAQRDVACRVDAGYTNIFFVISLYRPYAAYKICKMNTLHSTWKSDSYHFFHYFYFFRLSNAHRGSHQKHTIV